MNLSISDIADKAGVSKMTVSRVINNSPNVRAETRARIEEIIAECGYTRNVLANSLSKGVALDVVAVITGIDDLFEKHYFTEMIRQIESALSSADHSVYIYNVRETEDRVLIARKLKHIADSYQSRMIKGAVVIAPPVADNRLEFLQEQGVRGVIVGSISSVSGFASFDVDDRTSVREVVHRFVQAGHRSIGMLTGPRYMSSALQRENAFRENLKKQALSLKEDHIRNGSYTRGEGKKAALEVLRQEDRPTALFAANDDMALGVYDAAAELGLRVPQDISVIGFDDIRAASRTVPGLSTVRQPYSDFAALTAEVFTHADFQGVHTVPAEYIERESVMNIT